VEEPRRSLSSTELNVGTLENERGPCQEVGGRGGLNVSRANPHTRTKGGGCNFATW